MNAPLRFAILVTTSLGGFTVMPTQGADGTLAPDRPKVPVAGGELWRLRPAMPVPTVAPEPKARIATPLPEARRNVRLVYPALVEAR
ncbi:hypothetical protein [Methylobacterium sp. sgz302541]|uniref:hypothetical protein n=1 Tax=unclassified Methylobacterium TaxID=2615210 RepID=UPI003D32E234